MTRCTVGRYLVERLHELGVRHVFGVPGDYVLALMDEIVASPLALVGTCNELNAGYAADAYARVAGVGAVCVTYAVGGFSVLNAIAGAYAERVPVIALCGGPSRSDRDEQKLLHHTLGDHGIQVEVFRHVTETAVLLEDAARAPQQIDEALEAALRWRRPVFIEVPADLVAESCPPPERLAFDSRPPGDPEATAEAVQETVELLSAAQRPVILAGVEVHRFGLRPALDSFIDHCGYAVATTLMDKSVVDETHPQYVGIYSGALSEDYVRRTVEEADCVLSLGAWMTDINLGVYTASIEPTRVIQAGVSRVRIKHHHFDRVFLGDYLAGLVAALPRGEPRRAGIRPATRALVEPWTPQPEAPITIRRFFERINHFLGSGDIVLADAGDSFLCAGELVMHGEVAFICQAFYCSIGFTVPGALGVGLADPQRRPVVFVGDGAFQMTAQELSTLIRQRVPALIFVMNNRGYTVERVIHDGPYNDVQEWRYAALPAVFGGGWSTVVRSEGDLEQALERVRARRDELALIEVTIDPLDCSPALRRLGRELGAQRALSD